jgi:small basic protein
MLVADGVGIAAGVILSKHIPEKTLKLISAAIFIVFGLVGVYEVLTRQIGPANTTLVLVSLIFFCLIVSWLLTHKHKPA